MSTPPVNPYSQPQQPMTPGDEKLWSTLIHIGGIVVGFWAGLIGYLALKDRGPFIHQHSATALNFQLTMLIAVVVGVLLSWIGVGFLLAVAAGILQLVFGIIAALAANRGEFYAYPLAIPFVR